jgi:hypothetical protein
MIAGEEFMSTLIIAASVWTIISNNDAAIAEHKAKSPAATALLAKAPALLREADSVMAKANAAGHSIPEQPAFARKIDAIADQANTDLGLGQFARPLSVCADIAANIRGYYSTHFTQFDRQFAPQWRRDTAQSVKACRAAIRTPPEPEITISGPKTATPPAACSEIADLSSSPSKTSTWYCPKNTKL